MDRRAAYEADRGLSNRAMMAEIALLRGDDAGPQRGCQRVARRSYLYDPPAVSARRIRRRTEIALVAGLALVAVLAGWGLVELLRWAAIGLGSGLAPRLVPGAVGSVLMTLPRA